MKSVTLTFTFEDKEEALAFLGGTTGEPPATAPAPKKPKAAAAEEPKEEEEEEGDEEEEEEGDEEEEEEEEDGEEVDIKVTKALKEATKLREVLTFLMADPYNIKSKKKLLAAVLSIRSKVGVLQKLQDLETRVPRAAELIDPNMRD